MEYKLFKLNEQITSVGRLMVEIRDGSIVEIDKNLVPKGQRVVFLPLSGEDDGDYRWETGSVTGGNISFCEVVPGLMAFWATDPFEESVLAWRSAWQRNEDVDHLTATGCQLHHPDFGLDNCPGFTNARHAVHKSTSYYNETRCWNRLFRSGDDDRIDPNPRRKGEFVERCPSPEKGCYGCADAHGEHCISG
jgi:hypothetical protein